MPKLPPNWASCHSYNRMALPSMFFAKQLWIMAPWKQMAVAQWCANVIVSPPNYIQVPCFVPMCQQAQQHLLLSTVSKGGVTQNWTPMDTEGQLYIICMYCLYVLLHTRKHPVFILCLFTPLHPHISHTPSVDIATHHPKTEQFLSYIYSAWSFFCKISYQHDSWFTTAFICDDQKLSQAVMETDILLSW